MPGVREALAYEAAGVDLLLLVVRVKGKAGWIEAIAVGLADRLPLLGEQS